ncbi:UNVERIFIED_CONTAM: hypothetical protein K2H54_003528 [Gekko kuhli]
MVADFSERTEVRRDRETPVGKKLANGHPVDVLVQETPFLQGHLIMEDICGNKPEGNKQTQSGLLHSCGWCFDGCSPVFEDIGVLVVGSQNPSANEQRPVLKNCQGDSRISSLLLRTREKLWRSRRRSDNCNKWKCSTGVLFVLLVISVIMNICLLAKLHQVPAAPSPPDTTSPLSDASPCPQHWVRNGGRCYFFSDTEWTWNASQIDCSSQGGSLVAMDTPEERAFVSQAKRRRYYWIGLWRTEAGELWKWANGSLFNNRFPVGGEGLCAYLNKDEVSSTWCDKHRYWICSKHLHVNT